MSKIDLQAEIKAIQEFGKEAENLINKMNASAEKINEASDLEVQRIKKQIERDLDELSLYISERVDIDVSRAVEKNKNGYPLERFEIVSGYTCHSIDCLNEKSVYRIAIIESCYPYGTLYADGHWADEFPDVTQLRERRYDINSIIEILCRNWDFILEEVYKGLKFVYRREIEEKLKTAVARGGQANIRYSRLSAAAINNSSDTDSGSAENYSGNMEYILDKLSKYKIKYEMVNNQCLRVYGNFDGYSVIRVPEGKNTVEIDGRLNDYDDFENWLVEIKK